MYKCNLQHNLTIHSLWVRQSHHHIFSSKSLAIDECDHSGKRPQPRNQRSNVYTEMVGAGSFIIILFPFPFFLQSRTLRSTTRSLLCCPWAQRCEDQALPLECSARYHKGIRLHQLIPQNPEDPPFFSLLDAPDRTLPVAYTYRLLIYIFCTVLWYQVLLLLYIYFVSVCRCEELWSCSPRVWKFLCAIYIKIHSFIHSFIPDHHTSAVRSHDHRQPPKTLHSWDYDAIE